MAKKISVILLALVICLGIFVMPATAADAGYKLPADKKVAYEFKLDKENYLPGDTVTVSVYVYAQDGMEMGATNIFIGMDKNLFDQEENTTTNIKNTSTTSTVLESYFKTIKTSTITWITETVAGKIAEGNTADENALFNQYLKIALTRNTKATGTNASNSKRGLPASEMNGVELFTVQLKLKDDVAAGTAINIGTPTGAMTTAYANVGYFVSPFTATAVKTTAAESDTVFAEANVWTEDCAAGNHTAAEEATKVYSVDTTCTVDGKYNEVVMCKYCDNVFNTSEEKTETAFGHNMQEEVPAVAPTCTEPGKAAVLTCANNCGTTTGGEEVPAKGHTFEEVINPAPTCGSTGTLRRNCACGYSEKVTLDRLPHTFEEVPAVEPTCTEPGAEAGKKCSCGYTEAGAVIPAKGHTKGNPVVVAPTYTEKGYTIYTCSCGETFKEDFVDKLEANFTVTIKAPESTTVANNATVVLEAEVTGGDYTGLSIVWTADSDEFFEYNQTEDGKLEITAIGSGETSFTAELVDEEGNKYGVDTIKMTAEPDFLTQLLATVTSLWDKLLAFIMSLFMG
jgi:hypothetical protein